MRNARGSPRPARCSRVGAVVAQEPLGLPVRPALLGRGAAPADHPRAAARDARARARRARARDRPGHRLLLARPRRVARRRGGSSSSSTSSRRCSTTRCGAPPSAGSTNVTRDAAATRTALPHADDSFDAVVLTAVLGEIPDQDAALREIARVLRPGGRLVVGELFGDPHYTSPGRARARAAPRRACGCDGRSGPALGYFARLAPEPAARRVAPAAAGTSRSPWRACDESTAPGRASAGSAAARASATRRRTARRSPTAR